MKIGFGIFSIAMLVLLSFIAIGVFGFMPVNHENQHTGCIAALSGQAACPKDDPFGFINFHANALRGFSNGLVSGFAALAFLSLLFISLAVLTVSLSYAFSFFAFREYKERLAERIFLGTQSYIRWLTLRERGDAALLA
ncbi:MAG: hypothetical protein AAB652_01305 [Patescibacteria group bacterium]